MASCETPDFLFPMKADIYYPTITQGIYNEIKKEWTLDKTIICNATPAGGESREDIKPEILLQNENKLIVRTKTDIRMLGENESEAINNILITNIRFADDEIVYKETAGPRSGMGTLYEIATFEPFVGPFRNIEYYKMVWRRSENQTIVESDAS